MLATVRGLREPPTEKMSCGEAMDSPSVKFQPTSKLRTVTCRV